MATLLVWEEMPLKRVAVVIQREENVIDKCEVVTIGRMVFTIEIMMKHLTIGKTSFTIVKASKTSLN